MAWAYKGTFTVDHTQCGSSDSSSFPVLVSLTNALLKTTGGQITHTGAQSGSSYTGTMPYDLIFTSDSAGTTKIPWEIESYDSSTGLLIAWVKVGMLSHTVDTVFYCFFGDSAVSTQQNTSTLSPANVWNANYAGVWHYPDGSTLSAIDSTSNANNGTVGGSVPAAAAQIDGGASFSGNVANYIDNGSASSLNIIGSAITISCWVNPTSGGSPNQIVNKATGTGSGQRQYGLYINSNALGWNVIAGSQVDLTKGSVPNSTWTHVAGVYDGAAMIWYVNGVSAGSAAQSGNIVTQAASAVVGRFDASHSAFNGLIDELEISSVALSVDWILSEYNNQKSASTFLSASFAALTVASSGSRLTMMGLGS